MQAKATANDFLGRFREIVSDPLNLMIRRDPRAGLVDGNLVFLHNGLRVPLSGPDAYYEEFSAILVVNRGVHEPLEEFVFQEVLKRLPAAPLMLELGAYWGHYSMWLKVARPAAAVVLVEPELHNLRIGMQNFALNGFTGEFIQAFVGQDQFAVDRYVSANDIQKITILHCDIQGYEMEMLDGCATALTRGVIDYLFISTHSQKLHQGVFDRLRNFHYRIEISSDFQYGTTSFDGLVFASGPAVEPLFKDFTPMSRVQITETRPALVLDYLTTISAADSE